MDRLQCDLRQPDGHKKQLLIDSINPLLSHAGWRSRILSDKRPAMRLTAHSSFKYAVHSNSNIT